jgi:hypothetical protein
MPLAALALFFLRARASTETGEVFSVLAQLKPYKLYTFALSDCGATYSLTAQLGR